MWMFRGTCHDHNIHTMQRKCLRNCNKPDQTSSHWSELAFALATEAKLNMSVLLWSYSWNKAFMVRLLVGAEWRQAVLTEQLVQSVCFRVCVRGRGCWRTPLFPRVSQAPYSRDGCHGFVSSPVTMATVFLLAEWREPFFVLSLSDLLFAHTLCRTSFTLRLSAVSVYMWQPSTCVWLWV